MKEIVMQTESKTQEDEQAKKSCCREGLRTQET
jgi:hypothetical protein